MTKFNKMLSCFTVTYLISTAALADFSFTEQHDSYYGKGPYIGGQALFGIDLNGFLASTGVGGRVFSGFDFNKYLGFEIGAAYFPNLSTENDFFSIKSITSFNESIFDGLVKLYLPINNFAFLLQGGFGVRHFGAINYKSTYTENNANIDETIIVPVGGFGLQYAFTPHFAMDLTATYYDGVRKDHHDGHGSDWEWMPMVHFGLGVIYKF